MVDNSANVVITHVTTSGVVVFLIQWLKKSRHFPWITAEKTKLLRALAVIGAAAGAVGIHYTWNPAAHSLTIENLTIAGIVGMAVALVKSFVTQEIIYQSAAKNGFGETLAEILRLMKQANGALAAGPAPPPGAALPAEPAAKP